MTDSRAVKSAKTVFAVTPRSVVVIKRRQARENRAGVRSHGRSYGIEARKRRSVLDAPCFQGDFGGLFDHRFCTRQRRAGRQLHQADEIALVLLRDEARLRARELPSGEANQPDINHENDRCPPH